MISQQMVVAKFQAFVHSAKWMGSTSENREVEDLGSNRHYRHYRQFISLIFLSRKPYKIASKLTIFAFCDQGLKKISPAALH